MQTYGCLYEKGQRESNQDSIALHKIVTSYGDPYGSFSDGVSRFGGCGERLLSGGGIQTVCGRQCIAGLIPALESVVSVRGVPTGLRFR
ncbi:MAG: hypothetical protein K2K17_00775 [Lachnospiraceae bacterium]|nr:hypothetical protein [Lachnospiraceae bacterium]